MIYVSGSLAYDRIMTFPGSFKDHILPEKLHILNVCFLIDFIEEKRGGTAGNIAYNLRLLEESPLILAALGHDHAAYTAALVKLGLPMEGVRIVEKEFTAVAHTTTDRDANQIIGFFPGAMRFSCGYTFPAASHDDLAIVSPGNLEDMKSLPEFYRTRNIPFIYDPGQQIPVIEEKDFVDSVRGAKILIANDYEMEMIRHKLHKTTEELLDLAGAIITTLGEKGCQIEQKGEKKILVSSCPVKKVADPTGAGDAFRAGLLKGLRLGWPLPEAARLGSAIASFCVEKYGTQEHNPLYDAIMERKDAVILS